MTREEFTQILERKGYSYTIKNGFLVVTHRDPVDLDSLTTLPEGVTFENQGGVYLPSLTALPEGVTFENQGGVYLPSLTTLPEGVTFENQGYVNLDSLTGQQTYRGKAHYFRHIDGYTMLLERSRSYAGYTVHSARYFGGGEIEGLKKCYVAEGGGFKAHGSTMKEAIEDLQFKISENADKAEIAREVVSSGIVTLSQFRSITGACREGIRAHLAGIGINLSDIDSMALPDALKAMAGTSFGDTFKDFVETAK